MQNYQIKYADGLTCFLPKNVIQETLEIVLNSYNTHIRLTIDGEQITVFYF